MQIDRIIAIATALRIPILRVPGFEADDIIATLADRLRDEDVEIFMVSRDKDLDQLVGPHVVLYDPMKDETFDAASIEARKGYPPDKAVEVQTLTGDSTDNVPGVPGVGPKTAAKLIAKYGCVDEVLAHADELTPKLRSNLLDSADVLAVSRKLVTLAREHHFQGALAATWATLTAMLLASGSSTAKYASSSIWAIALSAIAL